MLSFKVSFEYVGLLKNIKKSHDISIVVKKVSFWILCVNFLLKDMM